MSLSVGIIPPSPVRPMSSECAFCSTARRLTFEETQLGMDEEPQDCLIIHELLHCHALNHGKLWKSLMRAHLGDYETTGNAAYRCSDSRQRPRLEGAGP